MLLAGFAVLTSIAVASSRGGTQAQVRWAVRDLGPCASYDCQYSGVGAYGTAPVYLINERGQITGTSGKHAFVWANGRTFDLGTLGGKTSDAVAINDRGQVIGQSTTESGRSHAFLWQKGKMHDLGVLPGDTDSEAVAINSRGQVVGCSSGESALPDAPIPIPILPCTVGRAFLWENGTMRDLGALPGDREVAPVAITDRGWIVGTSSSGTRGGGWQAFLWRNGLMIPLSKVGALTSTPIDLNERGQIVVETERPDSVFLWENGKTHLIRRGYSNVVGINSRGQIVGSNLKDRVFLWGKGRTRYLGAWSPSALNERGQIGGMGVGRRPYRPLLWENGNRIILPLLPGHESGEAVALNERNQIVGWSGHEEAVPDEMEVTVYKGRIVLWTLNRD